MKKRLLALVLLSLFLLSLFLSNILVNADKIDRIKNPEAYTDRIIIKEYDENGESSYKSVLKEEYYSSKRGSLSANSVKTEYIQPDYIRYAAEESTSLSPYWGKDRVGVQNLKDKVRSKTNQVIVAVLDTGIDHNHPMFKNKIIKGYNFIDDNYNTMDTNKHGTHVAGIIADSTNDNVKIMPIKVLSDDGKGPDYAIVQGIYYALDNGAHIINMSFGGPGHSPYMDQAIQYARSSGAIVVVSAGNENMDTRYFYPASNDLAIVVSATDINDNFATFSNYGKSVDISSPGVGIYSSIPNNLYAYLNGTSMSTPFVSAIASLLKQENIHRSPDIIENLLITNTDDRGIPGRDDWFGEGIINFSNYKNINNTIIDDTNINILPAIDDVLLDQSWEIRLNRSFNENEIKQVKIINVDNDTNIDISYSSTDSRIIVNPKELYNSNSNYYLYIELTNGNKYGMDFNTKY